MDRPKHEDSLEQQIAALFAAAVERAPEERAAFLDEAHAATPDLRAEIESLLAAHEQAGAFLHVLDAERAVDLLASVGQAFADVVSKDRPDPSRSREEQGAGLIDPYGLTGTTISHYHILELLGSGGMGIVYRAEDTLLRRSVALKFLPPELMRIPEVRQRFRREAQVAAALDHPNICAVHEISEANDRPFIVMAFVEGQTLKEKIKTGPLKPEEAINISLQVAEGLRAAHEQGIVHRDIKSANLMVTTRGRAKIMDFGIAKQVGQGQFTKSGTTLGTLAYMSPEQIRREKVKETTDLWSLGVVLYELLTGQPPFRGAYEAALLHAILNETPAPITRLRPDVPPALEQVVRRLLCKDPAQRYRHAGEVLDDLRSLYKDLESEKPKTGLPSVRRARRQRVFRYGSVAFLSILLVIGGRYLFTGPSETIDAIAVLPLENLSGDPDEEYFADGMTEALITELGKIRALQVISRRSVMQYKGTDLPLSEIARTLNVDAVVDGSVLQAGEQVRITVKLIHAATDEQMWGQSYNRDLRDVLALHSEMARTIAREIEIQVTPQEQTYLEDIQVVDPEAYKRYLKGVQFRNMESLAHWQQAQQYFERSIAKDPNFAPAYAGLARSYTLLGGFTALLPRKEAEAQAWQAVEKALELDQNLSDAYFSAGLIREVFDWDWGGAERAFRRAFDLNPGDSEAHRQYGWFLLRTGRLEEGLAEMKHAVVLDPLSIASRTGVAVAYAYSRRYDEAIAQSQGALELDSSYVLARLYLGVASFQAGRVEEAIAEIERAIASGGAPSWFGYLGYVYAMAGRQEETLKALDALEEQWRQGGGYASRAAYGLALVYAGLGENDQAFAWLERAYLRHSFLLVYLNVDPFWDPLRSDPRFETLLEKMGLG